MQYQRPEKPSPVAPRIIIHGGAGNITRQNLSPESYQVYRHALLSILKRARAQLPNPQASALDVATYAVSLLEENPLFNAGRGAVFTTEGTHELEASVMVSTGYRKRGVGVMKVRTAKSPIKLAREMLLRGELDDGGGAHAHNQLEGETCDRLNHDWGLESVKPSYFWTRRRWDEHRIGLGLPHDNDTYRKHKQLADGDDSLPEKDELQVDPQTWDDPSWNGSDYLPQGTVGAVVLDSSGVLCVATSTGGLTNKLPGRIGDTPTLGAGFWAEQWQERKPQEDNLSTSWLQACLPNFTSYTALDMAPESTFRAVAMSGTGNGDSFLRTNAARTAAAIARYAETSTRKISLQNAVTAVAGPHGQLQQSAGDRWKRTGEGEGGIIGIELIEDRGHIVYDHNCGGMFRAYVDDNGHAHFGVFQDEKRTL
ncbi:putative isoaspartyl peptidase/L-asparaginase [Cercospora beticola]|uniref:Putative isoaspartyl peptidase/L-asparaginase n=1 Tax=Cercospora beticola TaxID=122368 RepID=A0A2G5I776_CERBT|nr:putative isoaspartyl peptidase/L-asparaginase [Cercospora beticola]PIB00657.1 putative isoaspartyl peptidase/L-asparaginase [Cercospora beticola]WPA96342.1 hypothetical protein RHO25_000949 [Cercospora beticola]CAK1355355.1 unnamed protein product [Cercospora beticola]